MNRAFGGSEGGREGGREEALLPHEFSATRYFSESSIHLSIRSSPLSSSLFTFALFKLRRWRSDDATSHYSYL